MRNGLLVLLLLLSLRATADLKIESSVVVDAPVDDVWKAWTTTEGVTTFFAPGARIEPKPDGAYEIFFDPSKPEGQRGADGMRILVFEPVQRLAFTWNAPDKFPKARQQRTRVTIVLTPVDQTHTRVHLTHDGFGDGDEWKAVHAYFTKAWEGFVLANLKKRFESGPIEWGK